MSNEILQPQQFKRRKFQVADSPSGHPTWVADVPVDHLLKYAEPALGPGGALENNAGTARLTKSIQERGYDPRQHNGFDHYGTRHQFDQAFPPHLVYQDQHPPQLMNGNHRTWAAHRVGLSHLPTLITDMRSKP